MLSLPNVLLLNSKLPEKASNWTLAYILDDNNDWEAFKNNISGKNGTVIVIQDSNGDIFGMYASQKWFPSNEFYGDDKSFLFTLKPEVNVYEASGRNNNYQIFTESGIGMGGVDEDQGLFVNWALKRGSTSFQCLTFEKFWPLSRDQVFDIRIMELWIDNEAVVREKNLQTLDFYNTTVMWGLVQKNKNTHWEKTSQGKHWGINCALGNMCCQHGGKSLLQEVSHDTSEPTLTTFSYQQNEPMNSIGNKNGTTQGTTLKPKSNESSHAAFIEESRDITEGQGVDHHLKLHIHNQGGYTPAINKITGTQAHHFMSHANPKSCTNPNNSVNNASKGAQFPTLNHSIPLQYAPANNVDSGTSMKLLNVLHTQNDGYVTSLSTSSNKILIGCAEVGNFKVASHDVKTSATYIHTSSTENHPNLGNEPTDSSVSHYNPTVPVSHKSKLIPKHMNDFSHCNFISNQNHIVAGGSHLAQTRYNPTRKQTDCHTSASCLDADLFQTSQTVSSCNNQCKSGNYAHPTQKISSRAVPISQFTSPIFDLQSKNDNQQLNLINKRRELENTRENNGISLVQSAHHKNRSNSTVNPLLSSGSNFIKSFDNSGMILSKAEVRTHQKQIIPKVPRNNQLVRASNSTWKETDQVKIVEDGKKIEIKLCQRQEERTRRCCLQETYKKKAKHEKCNKYCCEVTKYSSQSSSSDDCRQRSTSTKEKRLPLKEKKKSKKEEKAIKKEEMRKIKENKKVQKNERRMSKKKEKHIKKEEKRRKKEERKAEKQALREDKMEQRRIKEDSRCKKKSKPDHSAFSSCCKGQRACSKSSIKQSRNQLCNDGHPSEYHPSLEWQKYKKCEQPVKSSGGNEFQDDLENGSRLEPIQTDCSPKTRGQDINFFTGDSNCPSKLCKGPNCIRKWQHHKTKPEQLDQCCFPPRTNYNTAATSAVNNFEMGNGDSGGLNYDHSQFLTQLPSTLTSDGNLVIHVSKERSKNTNEQVVPPCVLFLDCTKVKDVCVIIRENDKTHSS